MKVPRGEGEGEGGFGELWRLVVVVVVVVIVAAVLHLAGAEEEGLVMVL